MDLKRFERHLIIEQIGEQGQKRIKKSSCLVIGAGGLGSSAIIHLVANGIGKIGIIDFDVVDITNLHRQIIHCTDDIGKEKVISAYEKVKKINPDVEVEIYNLKLDEKNGLEIIEKYNFVIEATDNLSSKLLINDLCVKAKVPFSHAGINKFFGTMITVIPGKSACLRCVFKNIKPSEREIFGVFGPTPGVVGTIQAAEALKYLGKFGELLTNKILFVDLYFTDFRIVNVSISEDCKCQN